MFDQNVFEVMLVVSYCKIDGSLSTFVYDLEVASEGQKIIQHLRTV